MVTPMATVRLATEADIPRILELYRELVITTSHAEQGRIPSPDDFHRVFAEISVSPGHELVVAQHGDEVIGTLVLLIVPNLSHDALPWALVENMVVDRRHRRGGIGRLLMDLDRHEVQMDGQPVELTPTEFELLRVLMQNAGHAFTRSELIEKGLGYTYEGLERTVDSHVKNLRRKIEPDPRQPRYILTVYGVGYKFCES